MGPFIFTCPAGVQVVLSLKRAVYGALLLGTLPTVLAADQNFGIMNPVIALGIACTKAVIVILWFMHVKYQSNLIKMTVACGFLTFIVLVTMTLLDYISRAWGLW